MSLEILTGEFGIDVLQHSAMGKVWGVSCSVRGKYAGRRTHGQDKSTRVDSLPRAESKQLTGRERQSGEDV